MPRLFAALEVPHQAVKSLALLRGGLPNARWIDEADYHITLRFYGDVSNETADELVAVLSKISLPRFALSLKGLHVFSPKKPHSLYAAVENTKPLSALQEKIEHISRRIVPPETRKFIPHITLARLKGVQNADLVKYLTLHGNFAVPAFAAQRFCLMSARDSIGGGPYIIEETWPLREA